MTSIKAGKRGRIGFTVFAWHHGQFPTAVTFMMTDATVRKFFADIVALAPNPPAYNYAIASAL